VSREFKCCAGCCWCAGCCDDCSYEVVVESPPGQVIGYVKQRCHTIKLFISFLTLIISLIKFLALFFLNIYSGSCWNPYYKVLDENHQQVLKIKGPCCIWDGPCCPCDNEFMVKEKNRRLLC
jgi:hypothetical protein